jgi:copper chaperone CopZ
MKIRHGLWLLCFLFSLTEVHAQIVSVRMKIIGLTCSACSFGTERSIRQLKFVDSVKMDLNTHASEITFKKGEPVSIDKLVQKVYDAGFSVGEVHATWHFTNEYVSDKSWTSDGSTYCVLNETVPELKGDKEMTFVAEKYMSKKNYSPYKPLITTWRSLPGFGNKVGVYFVVF